MEDKRFLLVEDIARDLQVTEDTVRTWIRQKRLPAFRIGKEYRILKEDYEEFLRKRRTIDGQEK